MIATLIDSVEVTGWYFPETLFNLLNFSGPFYLVCFFFYSLPTFTDYKSQSISVIV